MYNSFSYLVFTICSINIPNCGPVTLGETVYPYISPLPLEGTGVHRCVFVLYSHCDPINIEHQSPCSGAWYVYYIEFQFFVLDMNTQFFQDEKSYLFISIFSFKSINCISICSCFFSNTMWCTWFEQYIQLR